MTTSNRLKTLAAALAIAVPLASAQGAALTYRGNLQDHGQPAEGNYDIELTLYSAQSGGRAVAGPIILYGVPVHAGSFSTEADFGARSNGLDQAWVGVKVRAAGSGDFAALDQRSPASIDATSGTCSSWALDGNAGNPAGSYLGTADNQPLVLKANGQILATFIGTTDSTPANSVALGNATSATGYSDFAAGDGTNATGPAATALGAGSQAIGHTSFAAGQNAIATHDGSFVWADDSSNSSFGTTAVRQFLIRATGGVGIGTNDPSDTDLDVEGTHGLQAINTGSTSPAVFAWSQASSGVMRGVEGISSSPDGYGVLAENLASSGGTALYVVSPDGTPQKLIDTGSGAYLSGSGQWTNASDRNIKDGFAAIDVGNVLAKVVALPVTNWFYKTEGESVRHIGPVAQDFSAAFGLGNSDKAIGTVDEGGVALAAIQGLNKKLEDENLALKAQSATLSEKLDRLAARVAKFETAQGE